MRLTVGPLPPAVYWRRRAIVLGAALVVLFLVAQACMSSVPADDRPGDGAATGSPSADAAERVAADPPATSEPPEDDEAPGEDGGSDGGGSDDGEDDTDAADPDVCTDAEIRVTAVAARTTFSVGESVQFTIRIGHDADRACDRDVGGGERELWLVRGSGADRVWSSRDCANPAGEEVVRLTSGWEAEHHIAFTGRGGAGCDAELDPGEYQLHARLGTARSEEPVEIRLQ